MKQINLIMIGTIDNPVQHIYFYFLNFSFSIFLLFLLYLDYELFLDEKEKNLIFNLFSLYKKKLYIFIYKDNKINK